MSFIVTTLKLISLFQMFRKRAHDFWTKFGNSDLSETRYADVSGLNLNSVPRDLSRPSKKGPEPFILGELRDNTASVG